MSENYEKALALHLSDLLSRSLGLNRLELVRVADVRKGLDDLGLKLVPLRGGPDHQGETLERRPGES